MKDKYEKIKLINIDPVKLFKEVKDEIEIVMLHLDVLQAIASSDCSVLELDRAFKKIDEASDILSDLTSCLNNRFQEGEEDV